MALTLIPTEQVDEKAALQAAWSIVADAYQKALGTPGLPGEDRQRFVRCAAKTSRLAARSPFDVVKGGDA